MNVKLHVSFSFSYLLSSWQNLAKTYIVRKGICRCNMQCKYSMNTEAMPNSWGLCIKIEPDFGFSVVNIWKVQKNNSPSFTQNTRHKIARGFNIVIEKMQKLSDLITENYTCFWTEHFQQIRTLWLTWDIWSFLS